MGGEEQQLAPWVELSQSDLASVGMTSYLRGI